MNLNMLKDNVGWRVQLAPQVTHLDTLGRELPTKNGGLDHSRRYFGSMTGMFLMIGTGDASLMTGKKSNQMPPSA